MSCCPFAECHFERQGCCHRVTCYYATLECHRRLKRPSTRNRHSEAVPSVPGWVVGSGFSPGPLSVGLERGFGILECLPPHATWLVLHLSAEVSARMFFVHVSGVVRVPRYTGLELAWSLRTSVQISMITSVYHRAGHQMDLV